MINTVFTEMLHEKDVIFEIFQYASARAAVVGSENIYDFSLGNPSVPAPASVSDTIHRLVDDVSPIALHSYSPGMGMPAARAAIAASLNKKYNMYYEGKHIFMAIGAAGALSHALRAVAMPGEEIITFAPCFSEYHPYTKGAGLTLTIIPADITSFQINFDAFTRALNPNVSAVLINSPNNPSGVVYSTETISRLASILTEKSSEYGHPIYLISDEPYRDIIFSGTDSPYIASLYPDTITCYSYSKSLSLPGERIGYLAVHPDCTGADTIIEICPQISRTIGQNGPAAIMQRTVSALGNETADLSVYEKNKNILYEALTSYGYECVEPGGTFYIFPQCPEADSYAFCERAKQKDLMVVPGDIFGCPGHFRIAYCVPTERVMKALPIFKELMDEYKA